MPKMEKMFAVVQATNVFAVIVALLFLVAASPVVAHQADEALHGEYKLVKHVHPDGSVHMHRVTPDDVDLDAMHCGGPVHLSQEEHLGWWSRAVAFLKRVASLWT